MNDSNAEGAMWDFLVILTVNGSEKEEASYSISTAYQGFLWDLYRSLLGIPKVPTAYFLFVCSACCPPLGLTCPSLAEHM